MFERARVQSSGVQKDRAERMLQINDAVVVPGRRAHRFVVKLIRGAHDSIVELKTSREHRLRANVVIQFHQCVVLDTVERRAEVELARVAVDGPVG